MNSRPQSVAFLSLLIFTTFYLISSCDNSKEVSTSQINPAPKDTVITPPIIANQISLKDSAGQNIDIKVINATFLNNEQRNYYGDSLPDSLQIVWKTHLGTGKTWLGGEVSWSGAGWTGQPLMVEENGKKFIIQGTYSHYLKKISADSGKLIWQYKFDDVIKGTGTIWINRNAQKWDETVTVMQGSRAGRLPQNEAAPSFRAVSYFTGRELWRIASNRTLCYSRDVDASCVVVNDTGYIGLENGVFTVFNPNPAQAADNGRYFVPQIYKQTDTLYRKEDHTAHGGNLVTEASPMHLNRRVYLASGSGRVWGYNLNSQRMDWEFKIGSDMDGSPVATADNHILIAVEKQFIKGKGGILKLNPNVSPDSAVVWYFPTGDRMFADWKGGIIGSISTNETTKKPQHKSLAACTAIDGKLWVVDINETTDSTVLLFDGARKVKSPKLIFSYPTGAAISTPLIIGDKILALTYDAMWLFQHDDNYQFRLVSKLDIRGEATPFVHQGRIYVASRDGHLYCIGLNDKKTLQ